MSYFDDKQEILKIELTTYGRYLISRGKFKPAYYAFFDDDVIYDGEYAAIQETQNSIQTRILNETPSLKPQTTFSSLENNVKLNTLLSTEIGKLKQEESQISSDKNYALCLPLGNSSINSDYAPAWSLRMIEGKINAEQVTQYIDNLSGNLDILQPFLKYPQINLQDNVYDIKKNVNDYRLQQNYNTISTVITGSDQYIYSMKDSTLIIDLKESNVDDLKNNFDIELFVEEQETIPNTDQTRTILKQLNFKKDNIAILNGILLDEPLTFDIEENESYSEFYFELTVDDEIQLPPQARAEIGNLTYISSSGNGPFGVDC